MRRISIACVLLVGCTGGDHFTSIDARSADASPDEADASAFDAGPDADVTPAIDAGSGVTEGMIRIPAGAFSRGCNPANPNPYTCDSSQLVRETPYRQITVAEFWIDTYEVTQEQYAACIAASACTLPVPVSSDFEDEAGYDPGNKPDHPVSSLTWANARSYCLWLGKRLPTEAEWEKAARGDDGRMYPWGNTAPTCARVNGAAGCSTQFGTHAVGSHPTGASPYGVQDMAGNVLEYVADFYSATYYEIAPDTNPPGPASGTFRVFRGGGFVSTEIAFRVANRSGAGDPINGYATGVRCAYSE